MPWQQAYDPFHSMFISTLLAAVPVAVMLIGLGFLHLKAHVAAAAGLLSALAALYCGSRAARPVHFFCRFVILSYT